MWGRAKVCQIDIEYDMHRKAGWLFILFGLKKCILHYQDDFKAVKYVRKACDGSDAVGCENYARSNKR